MELAAAFDRLFADSPAAVTLLDRTGRIRYANAAAVTLHGRSPVGERCHTAFGASDVGDRPLCRPECPRLARALAGAAEHCLMRCRLDARPIELLETTLVPIGSSGPGNGPGCLQICRPVDASRQLERTVAELAELFRIATGVTPLPTPTVATGPSPLSRRERQVLARIAAGERTQDIAAALDLQPSTVRNHVQRILKKLAVHGRLEAVLRARDNGWL